MKQSISMPAGQPVAGLKGFTFEDEGKSLIAVLLPNSGLLVKLGLSVAFAALTAGFALWGRFYLPDNPVPISLQTLGVLLAGGFLGWRWGTVSILFYYLAGLIGGPVFADGNGGWEYSIGVTGGYLIGFILAVYIVGWLSQRGWTRWNSIWAMLIGGAAVYAPASIWLSVGNFAWPAEGELLSSAVYPFVIGDLIKAVFAALVVGTAWTFADRRRRNRLESKAIKGSNFA